MKKQIFTICMIMLYTASAMAQQLVGESAPFVFNTQEAQAVPLGPVAIVITVLLGASFMLYRYWKQKKSATPDVAS